MTTLNKLYSNNMVLQRGGTISGYTDCEEIEVSLASKTFSRTYTARCVNGKFALQPDAPYGTDYTLRIDNHVFTNVAVGEVYLCGGQSNMEMPVNRTTRALGDPPQNKNIRAFATDKKVGLVKKPLQGEWVTASYPKLLDFYATAYYFALDRIGQTGIPIGLVQAAYGGATIEAWTDFGEDEAADRELQERVEKDLTDAVKWQRQLRQREKQRNAEFTVKRVNEITIPCGSCLLKATVNLTEQQASKTASLNLGNIIDANTAYVNGTKVGRTDYRHPPSIYNLPKNLLKTGENTIEVRAVCYSGEGCFVQDKPCGLEFFKTSKINGEASEYLPIKEFSVGAHTHMPNTPQKLILYRVKGGLYNGMLHELLNYSYNAILFYQGESDADMHEEYYNRVQKFLSQVRSKIGNVPFVFCQLPQFQDDWTGIRKAQADCLNIPNTAMASLIDLGELNDIHPVNKKDVGIRLSKALRTLENQNK